MAMEQHQANVANEISTLVQQPIPTIPFDNEIINNSSNDVEDGDSIGIGIGIGSEGRGNNINMNYYHTNPVFRYFQRLVEICSLQYLIYFAIIQLVTCGVFISLVGSLFLPLFKQLGVDAATEQVLVLVCWMPYSMGPLFGVVSDVIPLFGYHKKYWCASAIFVSALGCMTLLSSSMMSNVTSVVFGLVAMNVEIAVLNLLNEGKFSEIIREHPEMAADIITFNQALSAVGSLIAMSFVGPLSDSGQLRLILGIALCLALVPLVPVLLGWLPEKRRSPAENGLQACPTATGCTSTPCLMIDRNCIGKRSGNIQVALLVGIGAPVLAVVSAYASRSLGIVSVTVVILITVVISYKTLPRVVANLVGYTVITRASSPSLRSALQYFYTADEDCWAEGPHFSYSYYITINGIIGEIFMLVAIVGYQMYMKQWSYRSVLCTTLLLSCSGRVVDVIIVKRWNLLLGIPDDIFFLLGSSMLESLTSMLHIIPFSSLLGKVVPKGGETSTFAFVSGIGMFAYMWSSLVGAAAMDMAGLKTKSTDDEQCDFSSLPTLIVLLSIVLPVLVGMPAIFFFIPSALQTDAIVLDDEDDDVVDSQHQALPTDNEESVGVVHTSVSITNGSFERVVGIEEDHNIIM